MYYFYVLTSLKTKKLYFGFSTNLQERLKSHNQGKNISTKKYLPWRLVYYEAYASKLEAQKRELQIKKYSSAYSQLKRRIKQSISTTLKEGEGLFYGEASDED